MRLKLYFCFLLLSRNFIFGQGIPLKYEEINAVDFIKAVDQSQSTCIIPLGILEKHGPHLPLGTDLLDAREVALRAAAKEYTLVFPQYYFGQIYEAKHQPGTIAYSQELVWNILQETCNELSRNGIKKIILVNGHGGNNNFLKYFCQAQLETKKDYAVILFTPSPDPAVDEQVNKLRKTQFDGHAGEVETSTIIAHSPDLAKQEKAKDQSGADQKRLENITEGFTGIWWYAKFPNHYAGDGSSGNKEIGELVINSEADKLAKFIKLIKQDENILKLQNQFFEESGHPLQTEQ